MTKKLKPRQKKFIAGRAQGKTLEKSYLEAGYKAKDGAIARANASRLASKPEIALAIEQALEYHGATPEFAVGRLKAIAEQTDQAGASRLASKDILELHGWRRGEKPNITLDIKQAFFKSARDVIDVEAN